MDGGVPIKAPVSGIAMGLMYESDDKYKILTDIQGPEDHHGDMDFKVAGTRSGITAIQLDVKVDGVPIKILGEAMIQAQKARLTILDTIEKEIAKPRAEISPNAPKILTTTVKVSQIGLVIGPGGKTINGIKDKTGAEITIEDDGTVYVTGKNGSAEKALEMVKELTHEFVRGELVWAEVVKIVDFGAFVKLNSSTEGLVHVSEMATDYVSNPEDVVELGQKVKVNVKEVDEHGRINLSMIFGERPAKEERPREDRPERAGGIQVEDRPYESRGSDRPRTGGYQRRDDDRSGPRRSSSGPRSAGRPFRPGGSRAPRRAPFDSMRPGGDRDRDRR